MRSSLFRSLLLSLLITSAASEARAQRVAMEYFASGSAAGVNWARLGGDFACYAKTMGTSTLPFTYPNSAAVPVVVGFRKAAIAVCAGEATVCWTLTSTVQIGAQDGYNDAMMGDGTGANAGPGACQKLWAANVPAEMMPLYSVLSKRPGKKSGLCATAAGVGVGQTVGVAQSDDDRPVPLCGAAGDCTDASAGSNCNTSVTAAVLESAGGAFAVARAANATTKCWLCVEQ